MKLELPWPPRALHPNARHGHWGARKRATKKARADAGWAAREAGLRPVAADSLRVTVSYSPPDNRRRDPDGVLSNCKAYLDGIADVIGVDDSRWELAIRREEPKKPGSVRIEIEVVG